MNTSARTRIGTWIAAATFAALSLAAYEFFLRSRGVRPSVTDDKELWCSERSRACDNPRVLALCGASRIQLGFSLDEARDVAPDLDVVQLAIDGTNGVASFRELANDETFRGTALFSVLPAVFSRRVWNDQMPWVARRAAGWTSNDDLNRRWRSNLQETFSVLAPEAELSRVVGRLWQRGEFPEQHTVLHADRFRIADYSELPLQAYAAFRLERDRRGLTGSPKGADYGQWLRDVDGVEEMTRKIRARGGSVVIFHDHLSGEYRRVYEEAYPRDRFWNVIVQRSSAICIDAKDVPEIDALECPDGSHIDVQDAPRFTRALLREMRQRGAVQWTAVVRR